MKFIKDQEQMRNKTIKRKVESFFERLSVHYRQGEGITFKHIPCEIDKKHIVLSALFEGHIRFSYGDISELSKEFKAMGIKVGCNALFGDDVYIGNNVKIGNLVRIGECSQIWEGSVICDHVDIGECVKISNRAVLHDWCIVEDKVLVGEKAVIKECVRVHKGGSIADEGVATKCVCIIGSRDMVTYWGEDNIKIGCRCLTISKWKEKYKDVGFVHKYKKEEISEYKKYIDMIARIHKTGKDEK